MLRYMLGDLSGLEGTCPQAVHSSKDDFALRVVQKQIRSCFVQMTLLDLLIRCLMLLDVCASWASCHKPCSTTVHENAASPGTIYLFGGDAQHAPWIAGWTTTKADKVYWDCVFRMTVSNSNRCVQLSDTRSWVS